MVIMKDDTHKTNEQGDISPHHDVDLTGAEHASAGTGHIMPDVLFTWQQKAFIIFLFRIEVPSSSTNTPLVTPTPITCRQS